MKKLFSFIFLGLLSFGLLGCEQSNREELDLLNERITTLESEIDLVTQEKESLEAALEISNQATERLTFVIESEHRVIQTAIINDSKTAFELLLETVGEDNIAYSESEFGIFITSLYDITPSYGAYIMISKNGTPIDVGISSVSYESGDIFTFEEVFWDINAKRLNEAIEAFILSDTSEFLESMSYEYVTALYHLDRVPDVLYAGEDTSYNALIKRILVKKALREDVIDDQTALYALFNPSAVFADALAIMALYDSDYYDDGLMVYESFISNQDLDDLSFDEIAMVNVLLGSDTPVTFKEKMLEDVSKMTNSPSLSYGIMGVIAVGENPYEMSHDIHSNIVEALLHLQALDGGFLYTYDSSLTYMRTFSSPQSFLALVTLYNYLNGSTSNPYLIP